MSDAKFTVECPNCKVRYTITEAAVCTSLQGDKFFPCRTTFPHPTRVGDIRCCTGYIAIPDNIVTDEKTTLENSDETPVL